MQAVTIAGVPPGSYQVLVAMFAANGSPVGFSPPVTTIVTPDAPAEVGVSLAVTLTGLAFTPSVALLPSGTSHAFSATGTFSHSSTVCLTGKASWSSSTQCVATVDAYGGVLASLPGATTIAATYPTAP